MKGLVISATCVVLAIFMIVFALASLYSGLPKDGKWKGVITQYKEVYAGQAALIIIFTIVGHLMFLLGVPILIMTIREEFC